MTLPELVAVVGFVAVLGTALWFGWKVVHHSWTIINGSQLVGQILR